MATPPPSIPPTDPEPDSEHDSEPRLEIALALADEYATWWPGARWPARIVSIGALATAAGLLLLAAWGVLGFLAWLLTGLVRVLGSAGDAVGGWLVDAHLLQLVGHLVVRPTSHYLHVHAAGLGVSGDVLATAWLVVAGLLLVAGLAGVRGARIGWAVVGAATAAMAYAGAGVNGGVAAAAVAAIWSLVSIPLYWVHRVRRHTTNVIHVHNHPDSGDNTGDQRKQSSKDEEEEPMGTEVNPRYVRARAEVVATWDRAIAGRSGPLPGAALQDVVVGRDGAWTGVVQLVPGQHSYLDVDEAADQIASAYGFAAGSVNVRQGVGADMAVLQVFTSPGGADYQDRCPVIPLTEGREYAGETSPAGALSRLNHGELDSWAGKWAGAWRAARAGQKVDVEQVWRRLTRLRAGVLDALPLAGPGEVRQILAEHGLDASNLPADLALKVGLPRRP